MDGGPPLLKEGIDPYLDLPVDDLREWMRECLLPRPSDARGVPQRIKPGTTAHLVLRVFRSAGQAAVSDVVSALPGRDPEVLRSAVVHLARAGLITRITGSPPHVWRLRADGPARK